MKTITKSGISFNVLSEKGGFWQSVQDGGWEPETFIIMERYLDKDHSYLDIGAWIGPTVLFGAQLAKVCIAYESDPVAMSELMRNLSLNPRIQNAILFKIAIADGQGTQKMGVKGQLGDSMTSSLWEKEVFEVKTDTLGRVLDVLARDCNFIKMDIEGGEFAALAGVKGILAEMKPTLYLSLHAPWFSNRGEYFARILDVLSVYKNIYDKKGQKITLSEVPNLPDFSAIVATDL